MRLFLIFSVTKHASAILLVSKKLPALVQAELLPFSFYLSKLKIKPKFRKPIYILIFGMAQINFYWSVMAQINPELNYDFFYFYILKVFFNKF
jgi:hypothetical protein